MQKEYESLVQQYQDSQTIKPKYSVYIPSKGRAGSCKTVDQMTPEGIPINIVVEPHEMDVYRDSYKRIPNIQIIALDESEKGISYVRNFIKDYSARQGEEYSWCIDDNIQAFKIYRDKKKQKTSVGWMMAVMEEVVDQYENIGGVGMTHGMFAFAKKTDFDLNKQIYSAVLLKNEVGCTYRDHIVEDTDYSLQLLSSGLCTIRFNRFIIEKVATMKMKGGNTDKEYAGDGRLKRSLGLQAAWPEAKFQITEQYGRVKIKPSRIWRSFTQTPRSKDDNILPV